MPEQPYLYDRIESRNSVAYPYSDFNPKAVTQAHYLAFAERAERQKARAAQDGKPLINFNQHPDSYMIVNNPAVHHEPMPSGTKQNIVWMRWAQFALRVIQEIGAVGILICVICLKMKNDGPGWIIRVAPAWDTVITIYAVYHLIRPAKGRTPISSASYHFFALFMDTGLIPFYVFIALYANQNYSLQVGVDGRWTSFFATSFATTTVIFSTFVASIVVGALHLISIGLDLYLIVMFRKIARLPPDMNPLEDNLTGSTRSRSQKHKHKDSEMTTSSTTSGWTEKKAGYMSGSTLNLTDSRVSTATKEPEARTIPWSHSRLDSQDVYNPHNPRSAHLSRQQFDEVSFHQGPYSARSSHISVGDGHRSRAGTVVTNNEHGEVIDYGHLPVPPVFTSRPNSSSIHRDSFVDQHTSAPTRDLVKTQQKAALLNDNWFSVDDSHHEDKENVAPREPTLPKVDLPVVRHSSPFQHRPLNMNPPTPVHQTFARQNDASNPYTRGNTNANTTSENDRTLTIASNNTIASSVYSESAPSLKTASLTPKSKRYGDLASATNAVRGSPGNGPVMTGRGPNTSPPKQKEGRVVSRTTGVDIVDQALEAFRGHQQGQQRGGNGGRMVGVLRGRRDVSGKVAEEGRGGW